MKTGPRRLALWQRAAEGEPERRLTTQVLSSVQVLGIPAALGCLPWAVGGAWVSYAWSDHIVDRRQRRRAARVRQAAAGARPSPA